MLGHFFGYAPPNDMVAELRPPAGQVWRVMRDWRGAKWTNLGQVIPKKEGRGRKEEKWIVGMDDEWHEQSAEPRLLCFIHSSLDSTLLVALAAAAGSEAQVTRSPKRRPIRRLIDRHNLSATAPRYTSRSCNHGFFVAMTLRSEVAVLQPTSG